MYKLKKIGRYWQYIGQHEKRTIILYILERDSHHNCDSVALKTLVYSKTKVINK